MQHGNRKKNYENETSFLWYKTCVLKCKKLSYSTSEWEKISISPSAKVSESLNEPMERVLLEEALSIIVMWFFIWKSIFTIMPQPYCIYNPIISQFGPLYAKGSPFDQLFRKFGKCFLGILIWRTYALSLYYPLEW